MSKNLLSLSDYLGYPTGNQLEEQVATYAKIRKVKYSTRLYTKLFLDEYFETKKIFENNYDEINTILMEDSFKIQEQENQDRIF